MLVNGGKMEKRYCKCSVNDWGIVSYRNRTAASIQERYKETSETALLNFSFSRAVLQPFDGHSHSMVAGGLLVMS